MKNESFCLQYMPFSVILKIERKSRVEKISNKLVDFLIDFGNYLIMQS